MRRLNYALPDDSGLRAAFWNLNRQAAPGAAPVGGRGGDQVDQGVFKVTLSVGGHEVETKKLTVMPDPLFK